MRIESMSGTGSMAAGGIGINMTSDSVSKNIQNQIAAAQKELQELSADQEMKPEEKMKKKQELQQEISSLNQQLRQHQMELRREQQKNTSMEDKLGSTERKSDTQEKETGFSAAGVQVMLSADAALKQASVYGSVATQLNGRAGVLESEIKTDSCRGADTEKKEMELADLQEKAKAAAAGQISTLAKANKKVEEAAEEEGAAASEKVNEAEEEDSSIAEREKSDSEAAIEAEKNEIRQSGNSSDVSGKNLDVRI